MAFENLKEQLLAVQSLCAAMRRVDRQDCAGVHVSELRSHFHGSLSALIKLCRGSYDEEFEAKCLAGNALSMEIDGHIDEMLIILEMVLALDRMTVELPRCAEGYYYLHPLLADQIAKALACIEEWRTAESRVSEAA